MTTIQPGMLLAGKFRVERVLGQGGMGVVVSARHEQLDDLVAIKFLLPEALSSPDAILRFGREARAAVKIKNEHVARVSDVGTLDWGTPYMVMEYLHGQDLATMLRDGAVFSVELAVEYVLQACEAIAEAHTLGIVHRDLKPSNLFLTQRSDGTPSIKVLDFGISKVLGPSGEHELTRTAAFMGSPMYMSPEQLLSARDVDTRTDIWSLGVVLYELLTGGLPPFEGETVPQLCAAITNLPPKAVTDPRVTSRDGLEAVILGCLEKDRARRIPSVAELAVRLAPFAPPHCVASVDRIRRISAAGGIETGRVPPTVVSTDPKTIAEFGTTYRPRTPSRRAVIFVAAGALASVAAWLALSQDSESVVPAPSAGAQVPIDSAAARMRSADPRIEVVPSPTSILESSGSAAVASATSATAPSSTKLQKRTRPPRAPSEKRVTSAAAAGKKGSNDDLGGRL